MSKLSYFLKSAVIPAEKKNRNKGISCDQAQLLIQPFLEDNLEFGQLSRFMRHLRKCDECRDEYENRFLVYEGMKRIESGENFNFEREVREKLLAGDGFVKSAMRTKAALGVLVAVASAGLLGYRLGIFGL